MRLREKLKAASQRVLPPPVPTDTHSALKEFAALLRRHSLSLSVKTITHAFLLHARTPDDVKSVLSKAKTLSRIKSGVTNKRHSDRVAYYKQHRSNVNRILPNSKAVLDHKDALSVVFEQNVLKKVTDTMVFLHLPMRPELQSLRIKRAHFDGKYTACPRPFHQSVELRIVLDAGDYETTVTFARALLKGQSVSAYKEFFAQVRNAKLKSVPLLITDYEIAVGIAAKQELYDVQVRGCWYHYWNNLLCRCGLLERVTGQSISRLVLNFLVVLPFLHHKHAFLEALITNRAYGRSLSAYKSAEYKLVMYVFATYVRKFRHMFNIDMSQSVERTNNTCEGSNSGLARHSVQRLSLREFVDYVENTFKRQYGQNLTKVRAHTASDLALLCLQRVSAHSVQAVFNTLLPCLDNKHFSVTDIDTTALEAVHAYEDITESYDTCAVTQMDKRLTEYRQNRAQRRAKYLQLRQAMLADGLEDAEVQYDQIEEADETIGEIGDTPSDMTEDSVGLSETRVSAGTCKCETCAVAPGSMDGKTMNRIFNECRDGVCGLTGGDSKNQHRNWRSSGFSETKQEGCAQEQ